MTNTTPHQLPELYIGHAAGGEVIPPDRTFTIGRQGDLLIGEDNPFMHRVLLEIAVINNRWHIANASQHYRVYITDDSGSLLHTIMPLTSTFVDWEFFLIDIRIQDQRYVLDAECCGQEGHSRRSSRTPRTYSATWKVESLDEDVKVAVVALAEETLKTGDLGALKTFSEGTRRLGWESHPKRMEKRIEKLCSELAARGVEGLAGTNARMAVNRRISAIQYCLETRLITAEDLGLIEKERARNLSPQESRAAGAK